MIIRKGTHVCEDCKKSYEWRAIKLDKTEVIMGRPEDISSKNIYYFGIVNGCSLVASSRCPFCGKMQMAYLVNEPWPQQGKERMDATDHYDG